LAGLVIAAVLVAGAAGRFHSALDELALPVRSVDGLDNGLCFVDALRAGLGHVGDVVEELPAHLEYTPLIVY